MIIFSAIHRLIAHVILLFDSRHVEFGDRIRYAWNVLIHFAPVAFVLNILSWWFRNNQQFGEGLCFVLIANMVIGAIAHFDRGTFRFKDFLIKNAELMLVLCVVYALLEVLRYTAGDNIAGEGFRIIIQVMTLLYPISKSTKNIYILTKGQYPPEFIMRKLYNFEKNGDLNDLFSTQKTDKEKGFDDYKKGLDDDDEKH